MRPARDGSTEAGFEREIRVDVMRRFFRFLLGTKLGLFLLAGLVFGLSQAYSVPATDYIRHESTSTGTDVALRLVYFALMCLVAFSETLLVDELFFHGGWRKRVLGGQKGSLLEELEEGDEERQGEGAKEKEGALESESPRHGDGDGEDNDDGGRAAGEKRAIRGAQGEEEGVAEKEGRSRNDADYSIKGSLFRDYTVHVTLAFLVLLAGNYYLFNAINGQFDFYYRDVGYLYTRLRSPDSKTRRQALAALTPKRLGSVSPRLLERLKNGDEKERIWAIWGLGYRAEYGLLSPALKQEAVSRILPLVEKGSEKQRAIAAVALARLKSYRWLQHALKELKKPAPHPYFAVALGLLRDHRPESLAALNELLLDPDETRAMAAAWALGQMKVKTAAAPLRKKLFKMKGPVECVAVESLGRLGDTSAVSSLVRLFESEESDLICPQKVLKFRPDQEGGDKFFLFYWKSPVYSKLRCTAKREPLRVRIMKVLWRIGDTRILPWVRKMAKSGLLAPRSKNCAIRVYNRSVD